jgi:tetratricopeptide (TPR) repeat protein
VKGLIFAALAAGQAAPSAAPAQADGRIFVASGYVSNGGVQDGWFQLAQSNQRFRLPANAGENPAYARAIARSTEGHLAVRVRYDATIGRANPAGGFVEYPLCSISVANEASVGDEAANCPAGPGARLQTTESDLALGLALVATQPAEARRLLGRALETGRLSGGLRAAALDARGTAAEIIADRLPLASEAHDRSLADALADYRAWVAADPANSDAQYATARVLTGLGGYDEAMTIYRAIGRRWPEEGFNVAIRIGALYRQQGQYPEALRILDGYAAQYGPQGGMRFRYHRAWTLNLLDRPREALDDLDQGLRTQPDYPYAFFMRACSNAKLGRLREALADQERGLELLGDAARDNPDGLAENLRESRAAAEELRGLAASNPRATTDAPCDRLWQRNIRSRARSNLLGPASG